MVENSRWSRFWDESVARSGHTEYAGAILHRYDQPVRLATVQRIIRKLLPDGLRGGAVLDIGCGTGDFMALSLGQGAVTVDGVDVSPQVLAKATSRFTADARVRLRQGTVVEQVCEQGRYNLITSITVLQHHVEDEELIQVLGALRDALKPDGRIIVLELSPPTRRKTGYTIGACCIWSNGPHRPGMLLSRRLVCGSSVSRLCPNLALPVYVQSLG